jgi:hypothetical protein
MHIFVFVLAESRRNSICELILINNEQDDNEMVDEEDPAGDPVESHLADIIFPTG